MHTTTSPPLGEILLYESEEGKLALLVQLQNDTVWLTQAQMAELFGKERSVISKHISNAFKEGELDENSNVQKMHNWDSIKPTAFYSLGRITALMFVWFLERNGILYKIDGSKRLADNALVALTLMIAESTSTEKEVMVRVVVSLINQRN